MNCRQLIIFLVFSLFIHDAMSLVEYAEDTPRPNTRRTKSSARVKKISSKKSNSISSSSQSSPSSMKLSGMFDFKSQIVSEDVNFGDDSTKVSKYNFDLHTRLSQSIKADIKYQLISSKSERLSATSQSQKGNPEVVMGLNWINFGDRGNRTSVDILFGHRWGVTDSEFASSRNDFIFGVQSFKTLSHFAIGLGYTIDLTGNPQSASESYLGNIQTLKASLGWMVSREIRMAIHASRINITASGEQENYNILENDLQFTIINPELSLTLGAMVDLTMGAHFRSQSEEFKNGFEDIRLPQYNALWGNSIYSGLEFSL